MKVKSWEALDGRGQLGTVLARIGGAEHEHVLPVAARAIRGQPLIDAGVGDDDPLAIDSEPLCDVSRRELGVDDDHVARARRVLVLPEVLPARSPVSPLREAQRDEVVDHRRPQPAALARVHPIGKVKDVERACDSLDRRPAGPAPESPQEVRRAGQGRDPPLDVDPLERSLDLRPAARADRRQRNHLVLTASRLDETPQRAHDVAPDARGRERERGHVDHDAH